MKRKLIVLLLVGAMCLSGATALAYNEAPMLRVKVAAGELPPVEERLPEEPSVLEPLEEIGQYGGTIHVFAADPFAWYDLGESADRGAWLLHFVSAEDGGVTVVGDLAKGGEFSADKKSFTLYLREGAKWSDGAPFTADDIVFMYEDMHWTTGVETWWAGLDMEALKRVVKVDDYTVRYEMDEPWPVMEMRLANWIAGGIYEGYMPKHYLKEWHIKYNPEANELAKEEGFENWQAAFNYHADFSPTRDLNRPTMQAWILEEFTTSYKVHVRNPYYWKVDTAGNQLPYVDKIVATIVDPEVYQMKIIAGEADVAYAQTKIENYPLYKENEEEGGYRVVAIPGTYGADVKLEVNLTYPNDPARQTLYQDVRFRRALSLAINREEINETVYFGLGVPRQLTVLPTTSYYKKEWAEAYAQYDPNTANRLLNEAGLTERDKDGFRLGLDGKSLLLAIEYSQLEVATPTTLLELVKEYWENVGLRVLLKFEDSVLWNTRVVESNAHDIGAMYQDCCEEISNYLMGAGSWRTGGTVAWGHSWHDWLKAEDDIAAGRKTLADFEGGKMPGEEPPEEFKQLEEWAELRTATEFGSKEYEELSQQIYDFHADKVLMIGTVGLVPLIYIANKNLGNVPEAFGPGMQVWCDLAYLGDQLFWKK